MDVDKISIVVLSLMMGVLGMLNVHLTKQLLDFAKWQKDLISNLASLADEALKVADKEDA